MIHYLRALVARLRGLFGDRKSGSRVRRRDRDALAPAHRAICPPGDDRGRGRLGRAPPVRKHHFAEGGESRDAWNQIYRYALFKTCVMACEC